MRIYEGSPRQHWDEVLRSIGSFADREQLKELLLLELDDGFLLQALALSTGGHDADSLGTLSKRTYELSDERIAELMDEASEARGSVTGDRPEADLIHCYEPAMRVVGAWIDSQRAHDVFLFEQDGAFVVRLYGTAGSHGSGHQLAEFTRDAIVAMIEAGPEQRHQSAPPPGAEHAGEQRS